MLAEKFTSGSTTTWRNYIMADGERVAMVAQTGSTTTTTYFHQDHLGSVVTLTNASGTVAEQDAYDPWGKRRNTNGADDPNDTITSQTTRGYTDQEHLADSALIHMNARVYDPQTAKFTGPDPKVGEPFTTQGWDRYAYVANNPLNSTDPTGESGLIVDATPDIYPCLCMTDSKAPKGGALTPPSQARNPLVGVASAPISQGGTNPNTGPIPGNGSQPNDQSQVSNNGSPPSREEIVVPGERRPVASSNFQLAMAAAPAAPIVYEGVEVGEAAIAAYRARQAAAAAAATAAALQKMMQQEHKADASSDGSDQAQSSSPASSADADSRDQSAAPPNPNGRNGGQEHQGKVKERADQLESEGHEITAGGRRLPEKGVTTPEGNVRYPDISTVDPNGEPYHENVGRSKANGAPIAREQRALDDIGRATGTQPGFTPYDK